jgi:hypothetical protein
VVKGETGEQIRYYPEKVNRPNGDALTGKIPAQDHMRNWIDCVRSRKTPNASVDIGYRSAIAVHMANLAYRQAQRVTLESARSITPDFEVSSSQPPPF